MSELDELRYQAMSLLKKIESFPRTYAAAAKNVAAQEAPPAKPATQEAPAKPAAQEAPAQETKAVQPAQTATKKKKSKSVSQVRVSDGVFLNAVITDKLSGVMQDGRLYFVTSLGQFAFIISGVTFRGAIGHVFNASKPDRTHECKYGAGCVRMDQCMFYHDPIETGRPANPRNFTASSFAYGPRPNSRHYGNAETLLSDAAKLTDEEKRIFYAQVMHDLLSAIALHSM